METKANPVLVALSNPDTVKPLVGIGASVAQQRGAPLHLGTVVPRSKGGPPEADQQPPEIRRAEARLRRGVRFAKDMGVAEVSGVTEPAHRVARGLIRIVKQNDPALLVLGYSDTGDPFAKSGRKFDRLIDAVGARVDCPLAITSLRGDFPFKRLLVPLASGVNLGVVADIVPALKRSGGVFVTFMRLVSSAAHLEVARESLRSSLAEHGLDGAGELVVRATENVPRALRRESSKYDLTIVGAPRQRLLARMFGDTAERVARNSKRSVMIVRAKR